MTEALSKLFLGKSSAAENAHLTASLTLRKQRQPVALAANGLETFLLLLRLDRTIYETHSFN